MVARSRLIEIAFVGRPSRITCAPSPCTHENSYNSIVGIRSVPRNLSKRKYCHFYDRINLNFVSSVLVIGLSFVISA